MKLLRVRVEERTCPAALDEMGALRDLSAVVRDIGPPSLSLEARSRLQALSLNSLPLLPADAPIEPCVGNVGKIVCVGLNYRAHAAESASPVPQEPVLFLKPTCAIAPPNDDLRLPRDAGKTDWEVELGVVIGSTARYVTEHDAMAHVAGYCVFNDYSERAFQLERGGQWVKGKSADGFARLGPWLVTADEVPDPGGLHLWLEVNGARKQDARTSDMIFPVLQLVSYISSFMSLLPGDVIATGTPAGVGLGRQPPEFLRPGDIVTCGIEGLGQQRQRVVAWTDPP